MDRRVSGPPVVASKPRTRPPISTPTRSDGLPPPSTSVSALRSKLFGEVGSSATLPPRSPRPAKADIPAPTPTTAKSVLQIDSSDEEYDDVRNVVVPLRRTPSFSSKKTNNAIAPSPSLPKLDSPSPTAYTPKPPPELSPSLRSPHASLPPSGPPHISPPPLESPVPPRTPSASDPVPLADYMRTCKLPQKIRVYVGYNEERGKSNIYEGEQFYLHYQKNSQAVLISIGTQAQMMVPVNSGVEFGVIYNPEGDYNKAYQGYQFETVGQLLAARFPPSVVCVKRPFTAGSHESTIQINDVLLIKEVIQRSYGPTYISCLNMKTNEIKMLPETCNGCFTTYPYEACLYLHQIVEHLHLPLECLAIYNQPDSDDVRSRLPRNVLRLEKVVSDKSVVVSKPSSVTASSLLSICSRIPIEVQQMHLTPDESIQLSELTKNLYQKFNPVKTWPVTLPPGPGGEGLDVLCQVVNKHNPGVGIELIRPSCIPNNIQWNQGCGDLEPQEVDDLIENEYDIPDVAVASYKAKMANMEKPALPPSNPPSLPPSNAPSLPPSNAPSLPSSIPNPAANKGSTVKDVSHYDVPPPGRPRLATTASIPSHNSNSSITTERVESDGDVSALKGEVMSLKETLKDVQSSYQLLKEQTGTDNIIIVLF